MQQYLQSFKKYVKFSGRATRKELWVFVLMNFVIVIGLILIGMWTENTSLSISMIVWFSLNIFLIAIIIPTLAVIVRRIHDGERSGWWLLSAIVPLAGWLVLFILCILDSEKKDNKYGNYIKDKKWTILTKVMIFIGIVILLVTISSVDNQVEEKETTSKLSKQEAPNKKDISPDDQTLQPIGKTVAVQRQGNITNYTTAGNLQVTHKLKCITIKDIKPEYTPADLFPAVQDCIEKGRGQDAGEVFLVASFYGSFDKARVKDSTAHQAISALITKHIQFIDNKKKKEYIDFVTPIFNGDSKAITNICQKLNLVKPPTYFPAYMIYHGMDAFDRNFNPNDELVDDFNAVQTWKKILATICN